MTKPLQVDALRLINRSIEGAPAGMRELVLCIEIEGVTYEVISAMQSSPCIDDWVSADGVRDFIKAGCPRYPANVDPSERIAL